MTPVIERFLSKVNKTDTCWLWMASCVPDGYGQFGVKGKTVRSHRFSYEYYNGLIPKGLVIDHLCRVRNCVNPNHLEAVTVLENARRGIHATKTHCKYGHEFTNKNTRVVNTKSGIRRVCKECEKIYNKARIKRINDKHLQHLTRKKIPTG